jgi:hypothetical protein
MTQTVKLHGVNITVEFSHQKESPDRHDGDMWLPGDAAMIEISRITLEGGEDDLLELLDCVADLSEVELLVGEKL